MSFYIECNGCDDGKNIDGYHDAMQFIDAHEHEPSDAGGES